MSMRLLLRRCFRRCRGLLAILIFLASAFQYHILITVKQHEPATTLDTDSSISQAILPLRATLSPSPQLTPPSPPSPPFSINASLSSSAETTTAAVATSTTKPPRIFIGIFINAHSTINEQYKHKHLKLFPLWNDTRLCSITQIHSTCQVVYAFIYGSTDDTLPPYAYPINYTIHPPDSVQLHIFETMNEGKTPAFFQWAVTQSSTLFDGLDYIFKCDSDSFLRWNALLRYLYTELPYPPTPTIIGMLRHKAFWTNVTNETLWKQEWYAGMHLYMAGQLYGMTVDVAQLMIQEANQGMPRPYFAGHEDHDATSMIQVIHNPTNSTSPLTHPKPYDHLLRWITVGKNHTFWEHPVKGDYRWQRILTREKRYHRKRLEGTRPIVPDWQPILSSWTRKPSILLIFLNPNRSKSPQEYLNEWKGRNPSWSNVCGIHIFQTKTQSCDLYYVFVRGVNSKGPKELLSGNLTVQIDDDNEDTWNFPIPHKIHHGLVTTALYWIHRQNLVAPFDYILVLTNSSLFIQLDAWKTIGIHIQPSRHHATLLGEVRDKHQIPREFRSRGLESYWWQEHDNIHLYLASDCFALGSRLIPQILEQAVSNTEAREVYWENNVGHDITALAYMIPKTALHWVPITNSLRFWKS